MTDSSSTVTDQARPLAVAKPPSSCRLCNVDLSSPQEFRAHLKSDEHVHNLQSKVADTGSSTPPLLPPSKKGGNQSKSSRNSSKRRPKYQPEIESDPDEEEQRKDQDVSDNEPSELEEEDDDNLSNSPSTSSFDFIPSQCLFCSHDSPSPPGPSTQLEANLSHMSSSHGFTIPFQDCLAADVDLENIVGYLSFIINTYHECISCGTRRSTVEGVQQHMTAKGHCRFDISPETEDFYEMPTQEQPDNLQDDQTTTSRLLPSGKLISNRNSSSQDADPRRAAARRAKAAQAQEDQPTTAKAPLGAPKPTPSPGFRTHRGGAAASSSSSTPGTELATRGGSGSNEIVQRSEAILATQLSRLRISGDRVQQQEEVRKRSRLESANNSILRHHFRIQAGDGRFGKGFC